MHINEVDVMGLGLEGRKRSPVLQFPSTVETMRAQIMKTEAKNVSEKINLTFHPYDHLSWAREASLQYHRN